MPRFVAVGSFCVLLTIAATLFAADPPRPYRLSSVALKEPLLWGYELREPEGGGLRFGGMDQDADIDNPVGRAGTHLLRDGKWHDLGPELAQRDVLTWPGAFAKGVANRGIESLTAILRNIYFSGLSTTEEQARIQSEFFSKQQARLKNIEGLRTSLPASKADEYEAEQTRIAIRYLEQAEAVLRREVKAPVTPQVIRDYWQAQQWVDLAADACGSEPPPRAMQCRRNPKDEALRAVPLVYDPSTQCYFLFGGDHLDYLTNDLWVFDVGKRRWYQKHPKMAPAPRANHRLELISDGKIQLRGGYTYTSSTDYVGGQYIDLPDEAYYYDIATNSWTGGDKLVPADSRTYRTGALHPDYFLQGEKPDAAKFQAFLDKLPANRWVVTDPPYKPELNRDWGCARIDPTRDIMLRWSGGHSAHGGTDVPHFHFATNRWELAHPVEFPLGQLYDNTEYPRGVNFNRRPWMTGHTYQNYEFDPPSGKMVQTGERDYFNVYDPGRADWVARGKKPAAMIYDGSFYTLTLIATPSGAICWGGNGRVHRFVADRIDSQANKFVELELKGDKLPGAVVDNSTIAYDSQRDRVLMFTASGYAKPYEGGVWSLDLKTNVVKALKPKGSEHCGKFSHIDRGCYVPTADVVLIAAYLKEGGEVTRTPAYHCASDSWITLDLKYDAKRHNAERSDRAFPHNRSCGLVWDPKRELLWGTDTRGQIFVLRMDLPKADAKPLN